MSRPFIVERTKTCQVVVMADSSAEAVEIAENDVRWNDHDYEDTTTCWEAGSGEIGDEEIPYGGNYDLKTFKELQETAP